MKLRQIIIFGLILLMVLPLLAACNRDDDTPKETLPPVDQNPIINTDENPNLAAIDGGGREFHFLVRKPNAEFTYKYSEILDDMSGAEVNEDVVERNSLIEEKYNVIITATPVTNNMVAEVDQKQFAGDTAYDIIMPMIENAFMMACKGLLTEWDKIPFVNVEKSYWRKDIYDATTVGGYQFFAVGDQNFSAYNTVPVMFFNKVMHTNLGLNNLYNMVKEGTWTQAAMQEMATIATSIDPDGNGTAQTDIYGLVSGPFVWQPFFYASGMTLVAKDENDVPSLSAITTSSETTIDIIEDIVGLMNDNSRAGLTTEIGYSGRGFEKFAEGGCLFYVECIYGQFQLTNMEADYGILPMPVWNEGDKYTSYIHASHSSVTALPLLVKDPKLSGSIMEDMAYYSKQLIVPTFYEDLIQHRNVRDAESFEMLGIIFDNIILDLGQVMKTAGLEIDNDVRGFVSNDSPDVIASTFAEKMSAYKYVVEFLTGAYTTEGAKQYQ